MPNKRPSSTRMPHLPGYYYDPDKNRYFKGKRPRPPTPPRPPPKPISLPRLLHRTTLGEPTTQARLHATLLHPATPSTQPVTPTPPPPQAPCDPSDTLAYKLTNSPALNILAFPDNLLTAYRYCSEYPPLSVASYGETVAYATSDGVYLHQIIDHRWIRRKYQLQRMITAVSLSPKYLLMAGEGAKLYPLTHTLAPQPPAVCLPLRHVLSCDMVNTATFALGTRDGRVQLYDRAQLTGAFYPAGKQRSVTALRMQGHLVWCSAMRGGTNLCAVDSRDLKSPAVVCRGQSNVCKMVGMDAAGSLVVAGGDDDKVRVWDIRGGDVLSEIAVKGVVKRVKMVGWTAAREGACGAWLDTGDEVYARVVAR